MSCPAPAGSQRSQAHNWGGSEGGLVSVLCPTQEHSGICTPASPPSSPLAGGPGVTRFAEALYAATSQDAALCEAAGQRSLSTCTPPALGQHPMLRHQALLSPSGDPHPGCPRFPSEWVKLWGSRKKWKRGQTVEVLALYRLVHLTCWKEQPGGRGS